MKRSHSATLLTAGVLAAICFYPAGVPLRAEAAGHGKQIFEKRCTGCHAVDSEKAGPRLRGVFGRAAGAVPQFPYSDAIRKSGVVWDSAALDKWLADPDGFLPDSDMAFRVANPEERAAIIEYLQEISRK